MISEHEACAFLLFKMNNIYMNRNNLRTIFKNNKISYHKSGPKNHMKSKKEMIIEIDKYANIKINEILMKNKKYVLI